MCSEKPVLLVTSKMERSPSREYSECHCTHFAYSHYLILFVKGMRSCFGVPMK